LAGLVDCVNHIGAEHSSCAAFRLLDCTSNAFGLHETFIYARASFAADVYFRSYLQSSGATEMSISHDAIYQFTAETSRWRARLDESFPQLKLCRRNVLYDPIAMYRSYGHGGTDTLGPRQGGCDHRWQSAISGGSAGHRSGLNHSLPTANKLTDLNRLVGHETTRINDEFDRRCRQVLDHAIVRLVISVFALAVSIGYALLSLFIGPSRSSTAWLRISCYCRICRTNDDDVHLSSGDKNTHERDNLKNSISLPSNQYVAVCTDV
jgi:hypothetical protein